MLSAQGDKWPAISPPAVNLHVILPVAFLKKPEIAGGRPREIVR